MISGPRASIRTPTAWLALAFALATVAAVTGLVGPRSTATLAQSDSPTVAGADCPAMTDSVRRLYLGFFNREPSDAEFFDAVTRYQNGDANLELLAEELAGSAEMADYPDQTDEGFIDMLWERMRQRRASANRDFWIKNLEAGYPRSLTMLAFTESERFVGITGTAVPLSGYLRWYPRGVHWYCDMGPEQGLDIKPLTGDRVYADYVFHNGGTAESPIGMNTNLGADTVFGITSGSLPPGFTSYKWDGLFSGQNSYGTELDVTADDTVSWIAVFYETSIGTSRRGWQIEL